MKRLLSVLRAPPIKWVFLALALGAIAWFVIDNWNEFVEALGRLSMASAAGAFGLGVCYVMLTLLAWRHALGDLGHPISLRAAIPLFGISQLGKYVPGAVWNVGASAELGRALDIPRRRSVAAMSISILVSVISGIGVGALAFIASPAALLDRWSWILWFGLPLLVLLLPPVMNRLIRLAWRLARLAPLDTTVSTPGIAVVSAWSIAAWVVAGTSVAVLAVGLGAPMTWLTVAQCIGGYALAWVAGFVVVVAPAGAGVREIVLAAALAGTVDTGAVVAIVLLSRVALTVADLLVAAVGAVEVGRKNRCGRRQT